MKRATRSAAAFVAAGVALAIGLAPEAAHSCGWPQTCDPPLPPVDVGGASNGDGGSVNGTCTGVAGVTTDLDRATYVVHASATATPASTGAAPVGTAIVCHVLDAGTGAVYGSARGGQPGPAAHAVGAVTVPNGRRVRVCVDSNAVFSDGSRAHDANCR